MLANRVREYTTTVGTGDITLGGALAGHLRFADAFAAGDSVIYVIEDGDNYEIGTGTLTGGTTLARTSISETLIDGVLDKGAPEAVSLSGTARIYCAVSAEYLLNPTKDADVIREVTPDAGVFVDGVHLKDGGGTFSGVGSFAGDVNTGGFIQSQADDFQVRIDRGTSENWFLRHTADDRFALYRNATGDALSFNASLDASFAGSVTGGILNSVRPDFAKVALNSTTPGVEWIMENTAGDWALTVNDFQAVNVNSSTYAATFRSKVTVNQADHESTGLQVGSGNSGILQLSDNPAYNIKAGTWWPGLRLYAPDRVIAFVDDNPVLTLTAAEASFAGDVTIGGDLKFSGSATVIDTTTINTGDNIIVLNADVTGTPTENAGIEIERGSAPNASILWNENTDTFELSSGANFTGNITSGNHTVSDHLAVTGSGNARVTIGSTSGAASGATLNINGWSGTHTVNNRIIGYGSDGGGVRIDVDGAPAVLFDRFLKASFFGALDVAGRVDFSDIVTHNRASGAVNTIFSRGDTDANVAVQFRGATYNTYMGTDHSGAFSIGPSADLNAEAVFRVNPLTGTLSVNGDVTTTHRLGVGTNNIPAWVNGWDSIDFGGAASFMSSSSSASFLQGVNWYYDGNDYVRKLAAAASRLILNPDYIGFQLAESGTAGSNISWTTALGIDADHNAVFSGNVAATGKLAIDGGAKISVQNKADGGTGYGLYWWDTDTPAWVSYLSTTGASKSPQGSMAPASLDGRVGSHFRHRISNAANQGLIWENDSDETLMSLTADTGHLYTKGSAHFNRSGALGTMLSMLGDNAYTHTINNAGIGNELVFNVNSSGAAVEFQASSTPYFSANPTQASFGASADASLTSDNGVVVISASNSGTSRAGVNLQGYRIAADVGVLGAFRFHNHNSSDFANKKQVASIEAWSEGVNSEAGRLKFFTNNGAGAVIERGHITGGGQWNFNNNALAGVAEIQIGTRERIIRDGATGALGISGGSHEDLGGNAKFFGEANIGNEGNIELRTNTSVRARWNNGLNLWDWRENNFLDVGDVTLAGDLIARNVDDGPLEVRSGTANNQGGALILFGDTHPTVAGDIVLKSNADWVLQYSRSEGAWNFASRNIEGAKALLRGTGTTDLVVSGGTTENAGSNLILYGESHAAQARDIIFRTDDTQVLAYDSSEGEWDFKSKDIITEGNLQAHSLAVKGGTQLGNGSWPLSSVGNGAERVGIISDEENAMLVMANMTAGIAAGKGGDIILGGRATAGSDDFGGARVAGAKENGTSGDYRGYMSLATSSSGGTLTEAIRINSSQATVFRNDIQVEAGGVSGVAQYQVSVITPDANGNRAGFGVLNDTGGALAGIAAEQIIGGAYPGSIGKLDIWVQNALGTATPATFLSNGNSVFNYSTSIVGKLTVDGGSKIGVQNAQNGGAEHGLFWHDTGNTSWVSYMATASGQTPHATTPCLSLDGRNSWHVRTRVNGSSTEGILWENDDDQCLMSLTSDTGDLYTKGNVKTGDAFVVGVNGSVIGPSTAGSVYLSGGTSNNDGANIVLRAQLHADAGDFQIRNGTNVALALDASAAEWDFQNNDLTTTGKITASYLEYIGGPRDQVGMGNPEGIVAAPVGSTFRRTDGVAGGTLYVKSAGGTGSAGWEVAGSVGSSEWTQIHSAAPTGASVDVAGIPSGVNEVKILIRGVGSSGAGNFSVQLGNTSVLETTGYLGGVCSMEDDAGVTGNSTSFGSSFILHSDASNDTRHSEITLTRFAGHTWVISFNFINASGTEQVAVGAGEKTLSSALSTIRLNAGGASTFSGGNIRVAYR